MPILNFYPVTLMATLQDSDEVSEEVRSLHWQVCLLVMLLLGLLAAGALGVSLLRRAGSQSAVQSAQLERQLVEQRRENESRAAQLARVHRPEYLLAEVSPGLRPVKDHQLVRLATEVQADSSADGAMAGSAAASREGAIAVGFRGTLAAEGLASGALVASGEPGNPGESTLRAGAGGTFILRSGREVASPRTLMIELSLLGTSPTVDPATTAKAVVPEAPLGRGAL